MKIKSLNLSKFTQVGINSFLYKNLPYKLSRSYLTLLGEIYYLLKNDERKLIQKTIEHVFGKDENERSIKKIIKNTFEGIYDHYHEKLFIAHAEHDKLFKFLSNNITIAGEEQFRDSLAKGKGVILVTGHYGALPFLPATLAIRDYPVTMILRFSTNSLKKSLMQRIGNLNLQMVDAEKGNILKAAIQALNEGRILITECDEFEEWSPSKRKNINFLSLTLKEDRTLDLLQRYSEADVSIALMQRKKGLNFTLSLQQIDTSLTEINPVGQACLKVLESSIRIAPDHWYQWKQFGLLLDKHASLSKILCEN